MGDLPAAGIVAGVDHVTTVLADRPARLLFSALSRLGLYVVWPYTGYGEFASGGVRLGNLNLEVIGVAGAAAADSHDAAGAEGDTQIAGWPRQSLALAPVSLDGLAAALDQRGVPHGEAVPFPSQPGAELICTTMDLPGLGGDELAVQLCAYPEGPDTGTAPPRDLAGVRHIGRVILGAADAAAARQHWTALLAPEGLGSDGVWWPGHGPALEVRAAGQDTVLELLLQVGSLPVARAAFTAAGLSLTDDTVAIGTIPARLTLP